MSDPNIGVVVPGSGGCRKLRWGVDGRGKSGGVRIIYFYRHANGQIWMLTIYAKNEEESIPAHILRNFREKIES